ncbi:hypothetical protein BDW74DRAFT_152298 [Aspergillus multicolor]|uniref:uncharacterized protein n=1 Tax=Aspergillus multicolor TaxID=41759 RepID=UPI003CCD8F55
MLSSFRSYSSQCSLEAWAAGLQSYAEEHAHSVLRFRNKIHGFPDSLKDMIIRQSTPSMLQGDIVLLLTVGAGISYRAYQAQDDFYGGSSDSAKILRSFLNRLWSWEDSGAPRRDFVQDLVSIGALPFVDLCPWLHATGEDLVAAADFLKQYSKMVKPHIVLTLGEKPSSVISSMSLDNAASKVPDFWSRVGQLELIRSHDHCCIQIPCFHPGQGRFSVVPSVFLTILDRTLWTLLLTVSVSVDSAHLARSHSREVWCRHVKEKVEYISHASGLDERLQALKCKLYEERPTSVATRLTPNRRSTIAVATSKDVDYLIFSGFAVGSISSERRRQQAYRLWELNIPELHLHIGRDSRSTWFLWVNTLEEGKSLFVEAIASTIWAASLSQQPHQRSQDSALDSCILINSDSVPAEYQIAFLGATREQWLSYDAIVEEVTKELSAEIPSWKWLHADRISQEISKAGFLRFKASYKTRLNGSEINVWRNCSFPLYWLNSSGEKFKFIMRAPRSILGAAWEQKRYIYFTEDGIDLRDDRGNSFLVQKEALSAGNKVTFPARHLPNCQETAESGQHLVELWEAETDLIWARTCIPESAQQSVRCAPGGLIHPSSFYSEGGLSIIRPNWNGDRLKPYRRQPQPADETWLLWMCLKEHWPEGGTLFIGIPDKWPRRYDNIWGLFREFLRLPTYRHHPRLAAVQAWAHDISYTLKTPQMIKNLEYLCFILEKKKVQSRDYERVRDEGRDVKIAGTELRIKHRW